MKTNKGLLAILIAVLYCNISIAQNSQWTLPPNQLNLNTSVLIPLPQPSTVLYDGYEGDPSTNLHASYSDPNGNLIFFTVDEKVFDKNGYQVGNMQKNSNVVVRGFNERLILPMGNSCTKFAILTVGSNDYNNAGYETFTTSSRQRLYMSVYDMEAPNPYYDEQAIGSLEGTTVNPGYNSVTDISERDGSLYTTLTEEFYGWNYASGSQGNYMTGLYIASSKLIDNCFYYVFVSDGAKMMRYKLTEEGLEWDDYWFSITSTAARPPFRADMEMVHLPNGNYRIAVPVKSSVAPLYEIEIFDLNSNFELASTISYTLPTDANGTFIYLSGLEFDPTGRYLYFTHKPNLLLPNPLDVFDINTQALVTLPTLTNISAFEKSYIERYGDYMYMATSNRIGRLSNLSAPTTLAFNDNFTSGLSNYGNDCVTGGSEYFRYILPDQIDQDDLSDLNTRNCDCCEKWNLSEGSVIVESNDIWTVGTNPFGPGTTDVYIADELRVKAGVDLTISGLTFHFAPEARVVVERGDANTDGAYLKLINGSIFTADQRCSVSPFVTCEALDYCDRNLWQGVRVEGYSGSTQSLTGATTQGRFDLLSNSLIEYATVAVLAGHETLLNYGGGIVRVENSFFKDNPVGIKFEPYNTGNETLGRILNTEFTWTADLPSGAAPRYHVDVVSVSGIRSLGNTFQNEDWQNYALVDRGIGINSSNSRVIDSWFCTNAQYPCPSANIDRSKFYNLHRGISAVSSGNTYTLEALHGIYENNGSGIFCSKLLSPVLLDNDFRVPNVDNANGIVLSGCTGYSVENNYFTSMTLNPVRWNYGITVGSSGSDYNEIYRNRFKDITIGIISSEQNALCPTFDQGLKWKCNIFDEQIAYADIYVYSGTVSDEQGSCSPSLSTSPAGNFFSHTHSYYPGHYDLKVNGALQPFNDPSCNPDNVLEIEYKHHWPLSGVYNRLQPLVYTNGTVVTGDPDHVFVDRCSIAWDENACPVNKTSLHEDPKFVPGKSNGLLTEEVNLEVLTFLADSIHAVLIESQAILDGGNTAAILNAIMANDVETVQALVAQAGDMISQRVLSTLSKSNNEVFEALAINTINDLVGADVAENSEVQVSLPSDEVEGNLKSAEVASARFWNDLITLYNRDTLDVLSADFVSGLFETHQPNHGQKFLYELYESEGSDSPEWVDVAESSAIAAIAEGMMGSEELPFDIQEYYEAGNFDDYAFMKALNAAYISSGELYEKRLFPAEDLGASEDKSKGDDEGAAQSNKDFVMMPNPFNETLTLQVNYDGEYSEIRVVMVDLVGRKVYDERMGDLKNIVIHTENLPAGVMIYTIMIDGEIMHSDKLIRIE